MRPLFAAFVATCVALFFFGCSHYQLGTEGKLTFTRLYIEPVGNNSNLPQATAPVSTQLRDAFARDGRITLVNSPTEADAVLTVTLARYSRSVATARPDDTGLARKFDLTVQALCTLHDTRSNSALFKDRPVSVTRQIFTTPTPESNQSEQLQAEYNVVPQLAAALADRIAHSVLDVW